MKAFVEFQDGLSLMLDIPDSMRHVTEIVTGRPDKVENVTAKYVGWHGQGYPMYQEIIEQGV